MASARGGIPTAAAKAVMRMGRSRREVGVTFPIGVGSLRRILVSAPGRKTNLHPPFYTLKFASSLKRGP